MKIALIVGGVLVAAVGVLFFMSRRKGETQQPAATGSAQITVLPTSQPLQNFRAVGGRASSLTSFDAIPVVPTTGSNWSFTPIYAPAPPGTQGGTSSSRPHVGLGITEIKGL